MDGIIMPEPKAETVEATPRPWRIRVDDNFSGKQGRLVIEGDYCPDSHNPLLSYVVCADEMPTRRDRALADYELIVTAVNSYDATQTQLAELKEALRSAQGVIEDMRSENRLHGHITCSSAHYLIKVKPQIDGLLTPQEDS
jgi:hypothetical protein